MTHTGVFRAKNFPSPAWILLVRHRLPMHCKVAGEEGSYLGCELHEHVKDTMIIRQGDRRDGGSKCLTYLTAQHIPPEAMSRRASSLCLLVGHPPRSGDADNKAASALARQS